MYGGSSQSPKLGKRLLTFGRGAFYGRYTADRQGLLSAHRREYAGISNDKTGEKPVRRKPKISWAMLIIPG